MPLTACHAPSASAREVAKAVILQELGVERVARYCGVTSAAVWQWLSRGSEDQPIPPARVAEIVLGARGEGIEIDGRKLWPALSKLIDRPGDPAVMAAARSL